MDQRRLAPIEVPDFSGSARIRLACRKERKHCDIEDSRDWSASFTSRDLDLGVEVLAAMESASVRSSVDELEHALWVMDETRFYSRPMTPVAKKKPIVYSKTQQR
jgi:hypothetical protein